MAQVIEFGGVADIVAIIHVGSAQFLLVGYVFAATGDLLGWRWIRRAGFRVPHLVGVLLRPAERGSGIRSILAALIFGLLAAELVKPIIRYPLPPNDRFAVVLPFALAIGRIGCLLEGCCRGAAYDGWCAICYSDGIPRHAAAACEYNARLRQSDSWEHFPTLTPSG